MDEYFEREAAIKAIRDSDPYGVRRALGFRETDIEEALRSVPAADVAPVRHGSWKYHDDINFWRCSCCGVNAPIAGDFMQLKTNYCSYCGARMDGAE